MNYSSLTPEQRDQVDHLFADEVFGTDPSAYEYEVKAGNVVGRSRTVKNGDAEARHARKPRNVRTTVSVRMVQPSEASERAADEVFKSIARSVVERIQSQPVEAQ